MSLTSLPLVMVVLLAVLALVASLVFGLSPALQARRDAIQQQVLQALKRLAPRGNKLVRVPAFLIQEEGEHSLIVPPDAGIRLGVVVELSGTSISELVPNEILERGTDFVHYAARPK